MKDMHHRPLALFELYQLTQQMRVTCYETNIDGFASYTIQVPNDSDFTRVYSWLADNATSDTIIIADYPRMMLSMVEYGIDDSALTVLLDYLVCLSAKNIERIDP